MYILHSALANISLLVHNSLKAKWENITNPIFGYDVHRELYSTTSQLLMGNMKSKSLNTCAMDLKIRENTQSDDKICC